MRYRIPRSRREWLDRARETPRVRFSRWRRRVLVGALYFVLAFVALALPAASLLASLSEMEVMGLILLLWILAMLMLFVTASVGSFMARGAVLDARERAERDRANGIAFRLLEVAIILVTGYAIVASTGRIGLPEPTNAGQLMVFLMPIFFLALSLPPAVLAWTVPDPDPEPIHGSGSLEELGR
jgi:hypothetical protein